MPDLSPSELELVAPCVLIQVHNSIQLDPLIQIQSLISNMLDLSGPQPSILKGICPELDTLRSRYEALDQEMHKKLVTEVTRLDGKLPEFMKRVRMTMIPSIGYFLVVPKVGPKWIKFRDSIPKETSMDEQAMLS